MIVRTRSGNPSRRAGETAYNAVLTTKQVRSIRNLGLNYRASIPWLAKRFKVSEGCIGCILRGDTWKHLLK